ncbi:polysialyltransferase family glycosyltransferase [Streptomyces sp. GC420]|uniref:polysialyltransferase family glycosyltransferase n=1 Tax=Streptomyces sp. GC420 TaxID=2697568 RepID=UPI00141526DD|nr:polysialyltransferase family glycosyltransferase [Streptomyces sp. GC420]NBM15244.1 hypothetical protein [Streptomyces sp. GC420]
MSLSAVSRTTQIFYVSSLYGAATVAAAIDAGRFGPAGRRLLLVSTNTATPETSTPVDEMPGFERLRDRFDRVVSWNEAIRPFHPGGWEPRPDDLPLWERYVRLLWGIGEDQRVELAVESIQVSPALTLAQIFTDAPVTVYADGLMSYGPTRNRIDPQVGSRVRRLLHLDLVPGLKPLLLTEFGVEPEIVPSDTFLKVLGEIGEAAPRPDLPSTGSTAQGPALLLGQYLSALSILSPEQEEGLHVRMLRGAFARGHRRIVFKPHPSAPARYGSALENAAAELGAELTVVDMPVLAEVLYQRVRPALVVGCFSTALFTARALYGLPVARVGTDLLLDRLSPYQNSNRVPVTLADALLPDLESDRIEEPEDLTGLISTVGFVMQDRIHPGLRPVAERYLTAHLNPRTMRYFKRQRLTSLGLPGGIPARLAFLPRNATARRVVRRARSLGRAVRR